MEPTPRMRSKAVAIPAVTFLAAGVLASCGRSLSAEKRACVDGQNRVIDERSCNTSGGVGRYYYYRGSTPSFGSSTSGGSFTKGGTASIGRGGFGGKSSGG
jgi:hypothetical protein